MNAPLNKVSIFGFDFVSDQNYQKVLDQLKQRTNLNPDQLPVMITPNVDQVVKYQRAANLELYAFFKRAKYIFPDGQPLVAVSRLKKKNKRLLKRLTGSDFFPLIWDQIKTENEKAAFIVSEEKVGKDLQAEHARSSFYIPPFYHTEVEKEAKMVLQKCLEHLEQHQPQHLFIGLGFPKQEQLCMAILQALRSKGKTVPFMYLLGASMEFYTGNRARAPKIYRILGVEFLHRLFSDPKRMARRYLVDDLAFLPMALRELVR